MKTIYLSLALLFVALLLLIISPSAGAQQPGSVLIWPVNPVIEADKKAAALWLENPGKSSVTLQVRVYAWEQTDGKNVYAAQDAVVGTPPIVTIAPGTKQLVRLTRMGAIPASAETPYRIIIDEVPVEAREPAAPGAGISFRMRYSVPLFVAGAVPAKNAPAPMPKLVWRVVAEGGSRFVEVRNDGPVHARLTEAVIDGTMPLGEGLLGYVLAGRMMRWPLPDRATPTSLRAAVNGLPSTPIERAAD
ncbi:fimbrial chaperone protein [Sphingopyxis sp. YR583]|uniref:fimbrial biogenesis chaperone n=1 Tax=Sphingopyxis sp. YR583 TaxID=1881047 RepID=UPI0008A7D8A8|nr:molecular chaperone [Sphingopyxis sp. YR583]SEH12509.1 fimbrial chaperone protein [Sphingopyxis sp. YR583]